MLQEKSGKGRLWFVPSSFCNKGRGEWEIRVKPSRRYVALQPRRQGRGGGEMGKALEGVELHSVMIWVTFQQQRRAGHRSKTGRQRRRETNSNKTGGELWADKGGSLSGQQAKDCKWIQPS